MAAPLKASDDQCLAFIRSYITEHGYAPTVREVASGVGLVSLSSVTRHLQSLERRGLIRRGDGVSRAIAVLAS